MRRKDKLATTQAREEKLRQQAAAKLALGAERAQMVQQERQEVAVLARMKHSVSAQRRVEAVRQRATVEEEEKHAFMAQRMARHEQTVKHAAAEKLAAEVRALSVGTVPLHKQQQPLVHEEESTAAGFTVGQESYVACAAAGCTAGRGCTA